MPAPVLVVGRVKDAVVLDPAHATDGMSLNTTNEVLQNLVGFRPGTFEIVGEIAQRWSVASDGRTWTFDLFPHQVFSDGTPLDAAAVKFNLDRWRLESDPAHGAFAYPYYADVFGGFPGRIIATRVLSPTRLAITLDGPLGPFLRDLAEQAFGIGSPAAILRDPRAFEIRPVGSGAYTLAEWVRDDHITLVANPRYRGAAPAYKTVVIRDIPDPATGVLSIRRFDVDMLTEPRPDDARALAAEPTLHVLAQPPNNLSYLAMETERAPFRDVRVRRAVAYALDSVTMAASLYGKGAVTAANWTPPGMLGEDLALRPYPHDIARARALLADAGYAKGISVHLLYGTSPRPYLPEPQRVAETIQAELAEAGINVTLEPYEWGVFLAKIKHGQDDMCLIGWDGDNGDPDNFFYPLLDQDSAHTDGTAQNYAFWRDAAFHRLMLAGQRTIGDARRRAIYMRANDMVHDQVPAISLVHTTVPLIMRANVRGFVPSPNTAYHFVLARPATP